MELPGPLVDAEWLRGHLGSPGLVVVEVRWLPDGSGRARYEEGHVPGAVYLDVDRDLAGTPFEDGPGRHPLPSPEAFAVTLGTAGIGEGDSVVAYDDVGGSVAARLWWMLTVTGRACTVLDGGLQAWGGPLEEGATRRTPARAEPRPWPREETVDADELAELLRSGAGTVLDARMAERYRGEVEPYDPVAGHIPGARSLPWAGNLDPETERFRPPNELAERFRGRGARGGEDTVAYCGSGVTSCHALLAMEVAGLGRGRLYIGSWSDWCSDPSRPVADGDEPGTL